MGELRTERLIMRAPTADSSAAMIDIHGDPKTNRYRPGGSAPAAESAALLADWMDHWRTHGFGYWAIDLAETGETIGFGGIQHREFDGTRHLNLYYRFRPSAWGRGYASEMAAAAIALAATELPDTPVWIITNADNEPACRVAERLGFTEFRQADYHGAWARFYRR
ncbi:GNAT family N-acetyltransferase [Actinokineospora sp.]|uniref:GNAT family N-acetyltransferase n=1 Tax=Actinokineospora sp. TaxID=1872133 RepID=UPI004037B056